MAFTLKLYLFVRLLENKLEETVNDRQSDSLLHF